MNPKSSNLFYKLYVITVEIGQQSTIPIQDVVDYAIIALTIETKAHLVLECPLYNSNGDKFPALFEHVVLGSPKSLFQLDHKLPLASKSQRLSYSATIGS